MMRRPRSTVVLFLRKSKIVAFLVLVAILGGFFWWRWVMEAVSLEKKQAKIFVVKRGEDLASIAYRLKDKGFIRSSLAFKILIVTSNLSERIQAGSFPLSSDLSSREIASLLTQGRTDVWLTFPEGWRKEEVARRLAANLKNFDEKEFLALAQDFEGHLFPDTYLIPLEASSSAVIKIFENNFEKKFSEDLKKVAETKSLTANQVLILASIVERETKYEDDRPVVGGILIKRWQNNWPLQADATLQYVAVNLKCQGQEDNCDWWPTISKDDKEIDSPFNTYKYKGLPPTPICNPGLSSIKAVIYYQTTDYWFYLSDLSGKIHYAKTAEGHQQNITQYLR